MPRACPVPAGRERVPRCTRFVPEPSRTGTASASPSGSGPRVADMARTSSIHRCAECGHDEARWHGRCPGCGAWNTMHEEATPRAAPGGHGAGGGRRAGGATRTVRLADVRAEAVDRMATGIGELDRVLGGGIVPGSLVLIGGSPGIGKSTLTTMALANLAGAGRRVLYVSGEESERQIKLRGERLGITGGGLFLMAETNLERILEEVDALKPTALVVDSVQTVFSSKFPSAPGSISQVREVATQLLFVA